MRTGRMNKILNRDTEAKQPASEGSHLTTCFAVWFLTGWQRKLMRTAGNDWYLARVYARSLDAEDRHQRENQMGRYSLPNAGGMARELAAQDSESPTNING